MVAPFVIMSFWIKFILIQLSLTFVVWKFH